MIEIIPAIDIIDGRCVRLTKGDYDSKKVYDALPSEMVRRYADVGVSRVHIVDLDGAKAGCPKNLAALEAAAPVGCGEIEWGGGISSSEALSDVFSAGATQAIIGSVAVKRPELMTKWLTRFGGDRMILGADVRDGRVAVSGWLQDSDLSVEALVEQFLPLGLTQCIVTDISRDGMLAGPSDELYVRLQTMYPDVTFTVSGGISSMDDIRRLSALGLRKVIIGKAIYENRISLEEIALFLRGVQRELKGS